VWCQDARSRRRPIDATRDPSGWGTADRVWTLIGNGRLHGLRKTGDNPAGRVSPRRYVPGAQTRRKRKRYEAVSTPTGRRGLEEGLWDAAQNSAAFLTRHSEMDRRDFLMTWAQESCCVPPSRRREGSRKVQRDLALEDGRAQLVRDLGYGSRPGYERNPDRRRRDPDIRAAALCAKRCPCCPLIRSVSWHDAPIRRKSGLPDAMRLRPSCWRWRGCP